MNRLFEFNRAVGLRASSQRPISATLHSTIENRETSRFRDVSSLSTNHQENRYGIFRAMLLRQCPL